MVQAPWYRLLESLLLAVPPVIGVGIVGVLQDHPDPLIGRTLVVVASAGSVLIRTGVPLAIVFDGRELRRRGAWSPNAPLYALGALLISAPATGLLYLYRRHGRVAVSPGWDGWWIVVAASLGGVLSGVPVALIAYVLALPPLVVAIPAVLGSLALAAFPVGIYRDAIHLRNRSREGWRPNPALYLALAFASLLVTVLQPPVAAYYLYRRQTTLPVTWADRG